MKQITALIIVVLFFIPKIQAQDCTEDCVWPGDLNANGVANYLDFLTFGFCYQNTGPIRTNPSTMWEPLEAEDWAGSLPTLGTNFKHSDADGNGIIDEMDRFVIAVNYTLTNSNFVDFLGHEIEGGDLFAVPVDSVVAPGETLVFDIHLGTAANPINDIYGIGFQINVDTSLIENVVFDYTENWLGTDDEILIHDKYSEDHDFIGMAMTRFDGMPVSGFGRIARIEIVIIDVILNLEIDTTACIPFPIEFENVLGIDENEVDLFITTRPDSMGVKHPSQFTSILDIQQNTSKPSFHLYPNPTEGALILESETAFSNLTLYNQLGVIVLQQQFSTPQKRKVINLAQSEIPKGLYFVSIGNGADKLVQKVFYE